MSQKRYLHNLRWSSVAKYVENHTVSRYGAGTIPPSVLRRRSTTADGDVVGTAVIMAATAAAISCGVIGGHSSCMMPCLVKKNEKKMSIHVSVIQCYTTHSQFYFHTE